MSLSGIQRGVRATGVLAPGVSVVAAISDSVWGHVTDLLHPPGTFAQLLVDLAFVLAYAVSVWLLLVTSACVLASVLSPASGHARTLGRLLPRFWRNALLAVVGVSSLAWPVPAWANGEAEHGLDRPGDHSVVGVSGLRLPDRPGEPTQQADVVSVTVHVGDTLWDIAESSLPAGVSNAAVARACAAWYAANRRTIGADPDLILPGMSLHPPQVQPRVQPRVQPSEEERFR